MKSEDETSQKPGNRSSLIPPDFGRVELTVEDSDESRSFEESKNVPAPEMFDTKAISSGISNGSSLPFRTRTKHRGGRTGWPRRAENVEREEHILNSLEEGGNVLQVEVTVRMINTEANSEILRKDAELKDTHKIKSLVTKATDW
ncbi:hypothetical protein HUJ04_010979 [Dendroctonus ponderosae]|nr:hypothetical protein HUJ04_010979 [Dendroctonus ponderosae]